MLDYKEEAAFLLSLLFPVSNNAVQITEYSEPLISFLILKLLWEFAVVLVNSIPSGHAGPEVFVELPNLEFCCGLHVSLQL